MEVFSWTVFLMAVPAVIFAGISKGGFGSGVSFASSSMLAIVLDPMIALGLMLPLLMLIDFVALPNYWRKWDWPKSKALLTGSIPGLAFGVFFFAVASDDAIRLIIGIVALAFVAWQAAQHLGLVRPGARKFGPIAGGVAGATMAFTSFVSHAGGPVAAIYLLGQGVAKTAFQATTVLVFWVLNLFKVAAYGTMGVFTTDTLMLGLVLAPFAFLGTWIGIKAHHLVSERLFFTVTYIALTATGCKLIWDAVT